MKVPACNRRRLYLAIVAASQLLGAGRLCAGPESGQIVGGVGSIHKAGTATTINQQSDRLAIDWASFDLAADEQVQFLQPSSSSIALNRVLSHRGSEIHGRIDANGHVWLVNPNGVFFGEGSQINVGGMLASGLSIDPADFMNGEFTFSSLEGTSGTVTNAGTINAATAGSVGLFGTQVRNEGLISASLGSVTLAAGREAVVSFDPDGLMGVRVSEAVLQEDIGVDAAVLNSGSITAHGGRILLSASVSQDVFSQAVNRGDLDQASSVVVHEDGSFTLGAGANVVNTGEVNVSSEIGSAGDVVVLGENIASDGHISADSEAGNGGHIELHSADEVLITDEGLVSAQSFGLGHGGQIKLLGNKVGLFDSALVTASGSLGGGELLIGGDETGSNALIPNADFIFLGQSASAVADGTLIGDGGKVITFARDTARIHGSLSARGGSQGGGGGFVETSGLAGFEILSTPDITAESGTAGTWLIDPYNITITSTAGNSVPRTDDEGGNPPTVTFEPITNSSSLFVGALENALSNGYTVIVQTSDNGTEEDGNIEFAENTELVYEFDYGETATATLSLQGNNITFRSGSGIRKRDDNIKSRDSLNIELLASGDVTFESGTFIDTNGGDFNVGSLGSRVTSFNSGPATIATSTYLAGASGGAINIYTLGNATLGSMEFAGTDDGVDASAGNVVIDSLSGDIRLSGNYSYASSQSTSSQFSLVAHGGSIELDNVTIDNGSGGNNLLNLDFQAGLDITIDVNSGIWLTGGNLHASAGGNVVTTGAAVYTEGGNLTFTAGGGVNIGSNILTDGGSVTSTSLGTLSGLDARGFVNTGAINTSGPEELPGGNISITASAEAALLDAGALVSNGGRAANGSGSEGQRGGDITLSGDSIILRNDLLALGTNRGHSDAEHGAGGKITLDGNVELAADVLIEAGNATALGAWGEVLVAGTVDSAANGAHALIVRGSTIQFQDSLGLAQDGALGDLLVDSQSAVSFRSNGAAAENKDIVAKSLVVQNASSFVADDIRVTGFATDSTGNDLGLGALNIDVGSGSLVANIVNASGLENADGGSITLSGGAIDVGELRSDVGTGGAIGGQITLTASQSDGASVRIGGDISALNADGTTHTEADIFLVDTDTNAVSTLEIAHGSFTTGDLSVTGNGNDTIEVSSAAADWNITAQDSGNIKARGASGDLKIRFTGMSTLVGGAGNDTFLVSVTGDELAGMTVRGGAAQQSDSDTLIAANRSNMWTIGGAGNSLNGISFQSIENLTGNAGSDTFTVNDASAVSGLIDGGDPATGNDADTLSISSPGPVTVQLGSTLSEHLNVDNFEQINGGGENSTLHVAAGNTEWTLSGENGGSVISEAEDAFAGTVQFTDFAHLLGGTGDDRFFVLVNGASTGSLSGGGGANELYGRNASNSWVFTASGASVSANGTTYVDNFVEIQDLYGGSGTDTFNINHAHAGNVYGGSAEDGASDTGDVFNVNAAVGGTIYGLAGNDQFIFGAAGSVAGIDGGEGTDTLTGRESNTTWTLGASRTVGVTDGELYINGFSSVETLRGAGGVDRFNIDAVFGGSLYGGAGNDEFILATTGSATSLDGEAGDNTLEGPDTDLVWTISDENQGSVSTTAIPSSFIVENFYNIQNLQGGTGGDTFRFATQAATVDSADGGQGPGVNVVDLSTMSGLSDTSSYTLTLSASGAGGITNVSRVFGRSDANSEFLMLAAGSGDNTWWINGANDGTVALNSNDPAEAIEFVDFANLAGGTGRDDFIFVTGGSLSGVLDGGSLTGNSLVGLDTPNRWDIGIDGTGGQQGSITNVSTNAIYVSHFTNIQSLRGGTGDDEFVYASGAANVNIDGGSSTGNSLNLSALDEVSISVGSNDLDGVANIQTLVGNGALSTLGAVDGNNIWTIDAANSGQLVRTVTDAHGNTSSETMQFAGFANLEGGTGDDSFLLTSLLDLTGSIVGGAGSDTLTAANRNNTWAIAQDPGDGSGQRSSLNGGLEFSDIEQLIGGTYADSFRFYEGNGGVTGVQGLAESAESQAGAQDSLTVDSEINESVIWSVDSENTGTVAGLSFIRIDNLAGGLGNDTFHLNAGIDEVSGQGGDDTFNLAIADVSVSGGAGNDSFNVITTAGISGSITGGVGSDTLTGANRSNTWVVAQDNNDGNGPRNTLNSGLVFADIEELIGGTFADSFSIYGSSGGVVQVQGVADAASPVADVQDSLLVHSNPGESVFWSVLTENSGTVSGISFGQVQTLTGGLGNDTFDLNAGVEEVSGQGGDDTFNLAANVSSVSGGTGNDNFNVITTADITGSIDGGDGSDSLWGADRTNSWAISQDNNDGNGPRNTLNSGIAFAAIEELIGGTLADNFTIYESSGGVDGVQGSAESATQQAGIQDALSVHSSVGESVNWSVVTENTGTVAALSFARIHNLAGGLGDDTFNVNAGIGDLSGDDGADVFNLAGSVGNVSGGIGDDAFNVNTTADITGALDGGLGYDTLIGANRTNTWIIAQDSNDGNGPLNTLNTGLEFAAIEELIGGSFADAFTFYGSSGGVTDIEGLAESASPEVGVQDSLAFYSASNESILWSVTSENTGTVAGLSFTRIQSLSGGAGSDLFNLDAAVEDIDGGDGDDVFSIAVNAGSLSGGAGNDRFIIATADPLVAQLSGGDGSDTLVGANRGNIWTIDQADGGNLNTDIAFGEIENLEGNQGNDTFTVHRGASIESLRGAASNAPATGADSLTVQSDATDTINWAVSADNQGSVTSVVNNFFSIATLVGDVGEDRFSLDANVGEVQGGGGNDRFVLTTTDALTADIYGGEGSDILIGAERENAWIVDQLSGGNLNTNLVFQQVENLEGNENNDAFTVYRGASIASLSDAASSATTTGIDSLTVQSDAADTVNWSVTAESQGGVTGYVINFYRIDQLVGDAGIDQFSLGAYISEVSGQGGNDTFDIAANVGDLNGGIGNDRFTVATVSALTANVSGGDGSDTLVGANRSNTWMIDRTNGGHVNATLSFQQIENLEGNGSNDQFWITGSAEDIRGGAGTDTLAGRETANTWILNGNSHSLAVTDGNAYVIAFSDVETFQGGSLVDTINITGASSGEIRAGSGTDIVNIDAAFTGNIRGGADDDIFNVNAAATALFGEAGNDEFVIGSAGSVTSIAGGDGGDTLSGRENANTWSLNGNSHSLAITDGNAYVIAFSEVETFQGGSLVDTFNIGGASSGEIRAGAGSDIVNIDAAFNGNIRGGAGDDIFNVNAAATALFGEADSDAFFMGDAGSATSIAGGADSDSLTGRDDDNTWTLMGNSHTLAATSANAYVTAFSEIEVFHGGSAIDTFDITSASSGEILGGAGADVINISAAFTGNIRGGIDGDTFNVGVAATALFGDGGDDGFFMAGAGTATSIVGGAGTDSLTGRDTGNTWALTSTVNSLSLTAGPAYIDSFDGIETLAGGANVDTFNIGVAFAGEVFGGAGNDIFNVGDSIDAVSGQDGEDVFNVTTPSTISAVFTGGDGSDTLIASDSVNIWLVDGLVGNTLNTELEFAEIENLTGGAARDIFTLQNNGSVSGLIDGGNPTSGSDGDSLTIASSNPVVVELGAGVNHNLNVNNVEQVRDDATGSTLYLASGSNFWSIGDFDAALGTADGANDGSVSGESLDGPVLFLNFANLRGGAGDDVFRFSDDGRGSISGSIDGGASGHDTLVGLDVDSVWRLEATGNRLETAEGVSYLSSFSNIDRLEGGAANDRFIVASDFSGDLLGLTGDDVFDFALGGRADTVDGGSGSNTLSGRNEESVWTLNNTNNDIVSSVSGEAYVNAFSSIQVLQGGSGADIFQLDADFAGEINSGSGADTFNINAAAHVLRGEGGDDSFFFASGGSATEVTGGSETDRLSGRNTATTWTMTGTNAGGLRESAGDVLYVAAFHGIEALQGGSSIDTLIGPNQLSTWNVNGSGEGVLQHGATTSTSFSDFENLIGGQAEDHFVFANGGSIDGILDGGTSITGHGVTDTLDLTAMNGGVSVELVAANGTVLTSSDLRARNIESITAPEATQNGNYLTGASDQGYSWTIDGENQGYVAPTSDATPESTVSFYNFGQVQGGSNADRFAVTGTITGNIDGGSGQDLVDYSARQGLVDISLGSNGDIAGVSGINDIEGVIGNNDGLANSAFHSRIRVRDGNNQWVVGSFDAGTDGINDLVLTTSNGTALYLENFSYIDAGSGNDNITFAQVDGTSPEFRGYINGGGGRNEFDARLAVSSQTIQVSDSAFVLIGDASVDPAPNPGATFVHDMDLIQANASTDSSLTGPSVDSSWTVDSAGQGSLNGISFAGFAQLIGGSAADAFTVSNVDTVNLIDGGGSAAAAADTLDLAGLNADIVVGLGRTAEAQLNLLNLASVAANTNTSNTLIGDNLSANGWTIDGNNQGSVGGTDFSGFANLLGRDVDDTFSLVGTDARISGTVDGGGGSNTVDISQASGAAYRVELGNAVADADLNLLNVSSVIGNNHLNSELIVNAGTNTWTISGQNSGSVNQAQFSGFARLVGGSGSDDFLLTGPAARVDWLDGGQGSNSLTGSAQTTSWILTSAHGGHLAVAGQSSNIVFANIQALNGGSGIDVLVGRNQDNAWEVSGQGSGTLAADLTTPVDAISFTGMDSLSGNGGIDTFTFSGGSISGDLAGGAGDDVFWMTSNSVQGTVSAGSGDDNLQIQLLAGAAGQLDLHGDAGADALTIVGGADGTLAEHEAVATGSGELSYSLGGDTYAVAYTGLSTVDDDAIADTLRLRGTASSDLFNFSGNRHYSINNFADISFSNKHNLAIAADVNDRVAIDGTVSVDGRVTIQNASVSAGSNGLVEAASLRLEGTDDVGSATQRLQTSVTDLAISNVTGDVHLQEVNGLNFSEFSTNSRIDAVVSNGNVTSSVALSSTGAFGVNAASGDVLLQNDNALTGDLTLVASGTVGMVNNSLTNLASVQAQTLALRSGGAIVGSGPVVVSGATSLESGGNITLDHAANDFNYLTVASANHFTLVDSNALTLAGVNVNGSMDISSQGLAVNGAVRAADAVLDANEGAAVLANNIAVDNALAVSGRGIDLAGRVTASSIDFDGRDAAVRLNGNLDTSGGANIAVSGRGIVQNASITSGGSTTLSSADALTQNADISSGQDTIVTADTDITMAADSTSRGQQVRYVAGGTITLGRIEAEAGLTVHAGNTLTLGSDLLSRNDDIVLNSGDLVMNSGTGISTGNGSVRIASTGDIATRRIDAHSDVELQAANSLTVNESIEAASGAVTVAAGNDIALIGDLTAAEGIQVYSSSGDIQQDSHLQASGGDIAVQTQGNIAMASGAASLSSGSITYSGSSLGVSSLEAILVRLAAAGSVEDSNGENLNIEAQRLEIDAGTGIGSGDGIETMVNELSITNNTGSTEIRNGTELRVDGLRSNGGVTLVNTSGDVYLNNADGEPYSRSASDARSAGGTADANYNIGTLVIDVEDGKILATAPFSLQDPIISARNASLIARQGAIGQGARPLSLYVRDNLLLVSALPSWTLYAFSTPPAKVDDSQSLSGDLTDLLASGNEQMVEIEGMEDVDPAVFTNVRNYSYDDISIMLPRDQRYDFNDDEED